MSTEVYNAFREIGVSEEKSQSAATALNSENSKKIEKIGEKISRIENNIHEIKSEQKLTKWMVALVIGIQVIPYLKSIIN